MGSQPDVNAVLANWWGSGWSSTVGVGYVGAASNLLTPGGNPPYQISDFLSIYPKFGTGAQAITGVLLIPTAIGSGYQVGDVLTPTQPDSSGAQLTVGAVNGTGGITAIVVSQGGTGYVVNNGIQIINVDAGGDGYNVNDVLTVIQGGATGGTAAVASVGPGGSITSLCILNPGVNYTSATGLTVIGGEGTGALVNISTGVPLSGGHGSGAQINIVSISPFNLLLPKAVLQLYIYLATASIQASRWFEMWPQGMALFVAHFATLYLRSEGSPGTTAQQVAASGIEKGIVISSAAGDVSLSRQVLADLDSFAAWRETTYGTQLATLAKIVGMGTMYVY
jgi:hypothetical protein